MTERGVSWREFRERLREQEIDRQRANSQREAQIRSNLKSSSGRAPAQKPKGILRNNGLRQAPKEPQPPKTENNTIGVNDPRYKINPKKKFYHEEEVNV